MIKAMKVKQATGEYELLDSGRGRKLERFGQYVFSRPAAAAVWEPALPASEWEKADGIFDRDGGNSWQFNTNVQESWTITVSGVRFKLSTTGFGHVGIFPEQAATWSWLQECLASAGADTPSVLNLFAYSGGATLAAAKAGAKVCHLDASKGMTQRARENATLNNLDNAPVRWIVDDVMKFLDREIRRGNSYDAIILDPPSFGRGKSKEVFKIEDSVMELMERCRKLLSRHPRFVLLSCHTPAFTPAVLTNILSQSLSRKDGVISSGELFLAGKGAMPLPSGTFALWKTGGGSR